MKSIWTRAEFCIRAEKGLNKCSPSVFEPSLYRDIIFQNFKMVESSSRKARPSTSKHDIWPIKTTFKNKIWYKTLKKTSQRPYFVLTHYGKGVINGTFSHQSSAGERHLQNTYSGSEPPGGNDSRLLLPGGMMGSLRHWYIESPQQMETWLNSGWRVPLLGVIEECRLQALILCRLCMDCSSYSGNHPLGIIEYRKTNLMLLITQVTNYADS